MSDGKDHIYRRRKGNTNGTLNAKNTSEWCDGEHVMRWWVGDDPNQITLSDLGMYI